MTVRRRKTQSRIVRHHTTVIRSSYDHRATIIHKTILASHHAIIVKSYVIVRLSYDVVRFTHALASHQAIIVKSYVIVRLSYDVVRCSTILQKLSMCRKPIVSGVTTKLRLQYRSRIGGNFRNLRCHPSHDVAARCDQGFNYNS